MDGLENILYKCTLLHIICEHLHDLYTFELPFRLKRTDKIQTERFFKFPSNIYSSMGIITTCHATSVILVLRKEAEVCRQGWLPGSTYVIKES